MQNAQNRNFVKKKGARTKGRAHPPQRTQTEQPLRGWAEAAKSETRKPPVCSKKERRATLRDITRRWLGERFSAGMQWQAPHSCPLGVLSEKLRWLRVTRLPRGPLQTDFEIGSKHFFS